MNAHTHAIQEMTIARKIIARLWPIENAPSGTSFPVALALAGIKSMIPADQVVDAMKEVGDLMDVSLRETGRGGLAATREAIEITKKIQGISK